MGRFTNFEDHFFGFVLHHRKTVITIFLAFALVCLVLMLMVNVNYSLSDYLPEDTESKQALEVMDNEFETPLPNANVLLKDVSISEALEYKKDIEALDGVSHVTWLDDAVDINIPLDNVDSQTLDMYYKDGNALMMITIDAGVEVAVSDEIYELIGPDNAISGQAVDNANAQRLTAKETGTAMLIAVPLITVLLLISTGAFAEPLFFFAAIGVAILMNLGTNIIWGDVSFLTQAIAPILQLAVSLDYAIFLLHSFNNHRSQNEDHEHAMLLALKESFSTIAASAATTLFGFLALTFMEFGIGADMGTGLVKGVAFSFLAVMIFFPCLVLEFYKIIDKTRHRDIMRKFKSLGKNILKIRIPIFVLILVIMIPAYLAQSNGDFQYGSANLGDGNRTGRDTEMVSSEFGEALEIVILVPRGEPGREKLLVDDLENIDYIRNVISYAGTVGSEIPSEFLDSEDIEQFYSQDHARIIAYASTAGEGDVAFSVVDHVRDTVDKYYEDDTYVGGQTPTVLDMRNVVTKDNSLVNMIAIISIGLVILFTFRSFSFPVILVLTIETSIWINLSVPYFSGTQLSYIGYLIVSTVQLGATVDYAILLASNYNARRRIMPKKEAISSAVNESFNSILISAAILSMAGFSLTMTSTNPMVSEMGMLLCRGTILSFVMVVFFLPSAFYICDKIIGKTTWRSGFIYEERIR